MYSNASNILRWLSGERQRKDQMPRQRNLSRSGRINFYIRLNCRRGIRRWGKNIWSGPNLRFGGAKYTKYNKTIQKPLGGKIADRGLRTF